MKEKVEIVHHIAGKLLMVSIFVFVSTFLSTGFAKDFKIDSGNGIFVNANILYAAAKIDSARFSISYDGILKNRKMAAQSKQDFSFLDPENLYGIKLELSIKEGIPFRITQRLKTAADYFLRHIKIGSFLSHNSDAMNLIESKVKTNKVKKEKLDFNLSVAIGHHDDKMVSMEAVNFESYWKDTYVNAVYHFEKNEIEFGLSNSYINQYLLDGMKLELQGNPTDKSGVILLTKSL